MAYQRTDNRRVIHEPGTTPPAETREVKYGPTITYQISDPRTLLVSDALQNAGFKRDEKDASLWFTQDRSAFEQMSSRVGQIRYFVLQPEQARYAVDALREAGYTHRAWKSPFKDNNNGSKEPYYVLRNADEYAKANEIAKDAFRITPEQVQELQTAAARGTLTDDVTERLFKEPVVATLDRAAGRELTQNDAKRAMRAVSPALAEQITEIRDLINEGRLTEVNSPKLFENESALSSITQEQGYDITNAGRKYATAEQRVKLSAMVDIMRNEFSRSDERGIKDHTITEQTAKTLLPKLAYLSPEMQKEINNLKPGSTFETSAEKKVKLTEQLYDIAKGLGDGASVPTYAHSKRDAYFIAAANAGGLVLRDSAGNVSVAPEKDNWMPDELLQRAAHTEGADGSLIGSVVVIKSAKGAMGRPQIYPSSQSTLGGALALDDALAEAKAMGHYDPKVVQPENGANVTVWGARDGYVAAVTKDIDIMVVPETQFKGEPAYNATGTIEAEQQAAPTRRRAAGASR